MIKPTMFITATMTMMTTVTATTSAATATATTSSLLPTCRCHDGAVNQVVAEEGELISIGLNNQYYALCNSNHQAFHFLPPSSPPGSDGWIRVWDLASLFGAQAEQGEEDDLGQTYFR